MPHHDPHNLPKHRDAADPELFDIGVNLMHDSFDHDRDEVISRALAARVTRMLVTGSCLQSSRAAIELVRRDPRRFRCTAGVHPHHAAALDEAAFAQLQRLAAAPAVVAVGECGLDYYRNFSPPAAQKHAFRRQLALAVQLRKPLFLHQRDAHDDFLAILREHRPGLPGGVAHCFTADVEQMQEYLELGLYIGITGWICDERRGLRLREVVRHIPDERLLIETDAPYLLPRDLRPMPKSRRNEPCYLPQVLATLAAARDQCAAELALLTTRNALRLFEWAEWPAKENA